MPPAQAHIVPQPRAGTLCVAGCPAWQGRRRHQCCHYSGRPWRVRSTWPFRGENALHQCIPEPCCRLVHRVGSRGRGGLAAGCRGFCPYTLAPLLVQAYLCVTKDPGAPITDLEVSIPSLDEHPPTECALALLQLRTATVSLTHTHFWLRAQLSKHIAECAGLRLCAATRLRQQSSATACSQGCTFRPAATACARASVPFAHPCLPTRTVPS